MRPCRLLLPLAMTVSLLGCSESPETLKSALAKAIEAQDAKAIVKLVDLRGAQAMAHFMVYRLAEGCDGEMVCTVSPRVRSASVRKTRYGLRPASFTMPTVPWVNFA